MSPERVAAGDFNGDGRTDLVVLDVRLNLGTSWGPPLPLGAGFRPEVTADVNHDGLDDLIGFGRLALSRGDGTFHPTAQWPIANFGSRGPLFVRDFNNDGHPDILATETNSSSGDNAVASVSFGDGTGRFTLRTIPTTTGGYSQVGDFNGDGRVDFLNGAFVRLNVCAPRRRGVRH